MTTTQERCPGSGKFALRRTATGHTCGYCSATNLSVTYHRDDVLVEHTRTVGLVPTTITDLMHATADAYTEGYQAASQGRAEDTCPYARSWDGCRRASWVAGHTAFWNAGEG
jgi:ribosome modulation factor